MTIPYEPKTDDGKGFLVPIFKAGGHVHMVGVAVANEWPIKVEDARANLNHAITHIGDFDTAANVLSTTPLKYVRDWKKQVTALRDVLAAVETADPDALLTAEMLGDNREALRELQRQTWAMLAYLDIDLLGWDEGDTDAGRNP